jgi:RNA polymerase sigma factor (sigma-70 family)
MSPQNTAKKSEVFNNVSKAEKLFVDYGGFIRSTLSFNVKNEALSDDLFQDLFLFFVSKPIGKDIKNVKGFLYRVISDRIKDNIRRRNRYRSRINRYAEYYSYNIQTLPENVLIEQEEIKKMFEMIKKRLPTNEALAMTLKYKNNRSISLIADEMGIRTKSVSRYISVGLKKIRQIFDMN